MATNAAIILCSGGLDSVTVAHYVKKKLSYKTITILFFNYGQRNLQQERLASKKCARNLKANFIEIKTQFLKQLSNSIINSNKRHKKLSRKNLKNTKQESEKYYVPCRNTIFLINALALADSRFVKSKIRSNIFVGFKNEGKEAYPDTTPDFVKKINTLSKTSCKAHFKIFAPLIKKDKEDIIKLGTKMGVNYKNTYTCYIGTKNKNKFEHCGTCLSCRLRQEGFYWANIPDPTRYKELPKDFRIAKN